MRDHVEHEDEKPLSRGRRRSFDSKTRCRLEEENRKILSAYIEITATRSFCQERVVGSGGARVGTTRLSTLKEQHSPLGNPAYASTVSTVETFLVARNDFADQVVIHTVGDENIHDLADLRVTIIDQHDPVDIGRLLRHPALQKELGLFT